MKRATFLAALLGLCAAFVSATLAGCGGGGTSNSATGGGARGAGTVRMVIKWPQA